MARRYKLGIHGFEQNIEECLKYYQLAAKQENPNAQYEMGELYQFGVDNILKPNPKKSKFWIRKAALNGHFFARLRFGYQVEWSELLNEISLEEGNSSQELQEILKSTVPLVAKEHEAIYQRFLNGKLIYKHPHGKYDIGKIELSISPCVRIVVASELN